MVLHLLSQLSPLLFFLLLHRLVDVAKQRGEPVAFLFLNRRFIFIPSVTLSHPVNGLWASERAQIDGRRDASSAYPFPKFTYRTDDIGPAEERVALIRPELVQITRNPAHGFRSFEKRKHELFSFHSPHVFTIYFLSHFDDITVPVAFVHRVEIHAGF